MRIVASIKCTLVIEFDDDESNLDLRDQAFDRLRDRLGFDIEIADSETPVIEKKK